MKLLGYWVNVIVVAVLLNISYYYTLKELHNKSVNVFNYTLVAWDGKIVVFDRIKQIEKKVKKKNE